MTYEPSRLAELQRAAADLFAVLVGATVFAADFSVPAVCWSAPARRLAESQAILCCGAFSWPACEDQKDRFGSAARERLPYVGSRPPGHDFAPGSLGERCPCARTPT